MLDKELKQNLSFVTQILKVTYSKQMLESKDKAGPTVLSFDS